MRQVGFDIEADAVEADPASQFDAKRCDFIFLVGALRRPRANF
ncbi:hypothetical protein ABI_31500 [Asticcacaulis biprosthecium C19]|uniref:Uncharacterized protein n=1 Tax=Asticcacaulis biprosthecium C19 TaxID=715226 RepID=F4QRL1_9CAUL|nr:hypothetical protein ABI_31500 [Asticcacaulis biprosthecium C19]